MNITIDDTSPQFNWLSKGNTWEITHPDDPFTSHYFLRTFHATRADGDAVRLKFNGTAIYIYGAKRENHGVYSVIMDYGNPTYHLGHSDTEDIQQLLYYQAGLDPGKEHTIELTNLPSRTDPPGNATLNWWFDIDYAVISTAMTGEIFTTIYDDTSSFVAYAGNGWTQGPGTQPERYNARTSHISQSSGDAVTLNFKGSSIQVFGGLASDRGNYQVLLDGVQKRNSSGFWPELQTGASLFVATGLEDGPHQIVLTNLGRGDNGDVFEIDYVVVNSTVHPHIDGGGLGSTGTNTTGTIVGSESGSSDGTSVRAIVGGAVGGAVALILLGLLVWFLLRRKRAYARRRDGYDVPMDLTGDEVKPYIQPTDSHHAYALAGGHVLPSDYSSTLDSGLGGYNIQGPHTPIRGPFLTVIPPPPASNATSYPHSINPPSSAGSPDNTDENPFIGGSHSTRRSGRTAHLQTTFALPVPGISSGGAGSSDESSPTRVETATRSPTTKSPGIAVPYSARSASSPNDALPSGRLRKEGRETDMGPLRISEDMEADDDLLPPDYQQATEPLPGRQPQGPGSG